MPLKQRSIIATAIASAIIWLAGYKTASYYQEKIADIISERPGLSYFMPFVYRPYSIENLNMETKQKVKDLELRRNIADTAGVAGLASLITNVILLKRKR